jgi:hypothetical protein
VSLKNVTHFHIFIFISFSFLFSCFILIFMFHSSVSFFVFISLVAVSMWTLCAREVLFIWKIDTRKLIMLDDIRRELKARRQYHGVPHDTVCWNNEIVASHK